MKNIIIIHINNNNSKVDNKSKCQSCEDTYLLKTPSETLCYP